MDWKETLQRMNQKVREKEAAKIRENQERRRMKKEDDLLIGSIRPQVEEVLAAFAKALPAGWRKEGDVIKCASERYSTVDISYRYLIIVHFRYRRVSIDTPYIEIESDYYREFGPPPVSIKFAHKYNIANPNSREITVEIPFKNFTKEKLAEVLMDIYEARIVD